MHHHNNTECLIHPPWMFPCAHPTQSSRVRQQVSTHDVLRTTGSIACSNLGQQAAVLKSTPTSSLHPSSPGYHHLHPLLLLLPFLDPPFCCPCTSFLHFSLLPNKQPTLNCFFPTSIPFFTHSSQHCKPGLR